MPGDSIRDLFIPFPCSHMFTLSGAEKGISTIKSETTAQAFLYSPWHQGNQSSRSRCHAETQNRCQTNHLSRKDNTGNVTPKVHAAIENRKSHTSWLLDKPVETKALSMFLNTRSSYMMERKSCWSGLIKLAV